MKEDVIRALRQIEASAGTGIWDAHRGCAAIAGALLVEQELVCAAAKDDVVALVRALMSGVDERPLKTSEGRRIVSHQSPSQTLT